MGEENEQKSRPVTKEEAELRESQEQFKLDRKASALHFLEKSLSINEHLNKTENNCIKRNAVICSILLLLATGGISPIDKINIGGLQFGFSLPLLMIILCFTLSWNLYIFNFTQTKSQQLYRKIKEYYDRVNYGFDFRRSMLEYTSYLSNFMDIVPDATDDKKNLFLATIDGVILILGASVLIALPPIVQIITFVKLVKLLGWHWWLILTFLIILITSIKASWTINDSASKAKYN